MARSARALGWLAVVALLAAGCSDGSSTPDAAADAQLGAGSDVSERGDPVRGGSITVGLEAETNGWLPGTGNFSNPGIAVALAIYDPLLRRDERGELRPYLAESVVASRDLTEWTVRLRGGVQFHDGTPLDAQAVKTGFDEYVSAPSSNLAAQVADVASVDVVDDLTLVYRLEAPNAAFDAVLAGAVGWIFSPTAAKAAGADAAAKPVGTGPFVLTQWERDSRLVVKRNPSYWQEGLPYLDEIVFRPIPDEEARVSSLVSGDIDVLQSLRESIVRRARSLEGVDSYEYVGNNAGSVIFNTAKPPFDDLRVRRAVAYALDQEQLIAVVGGKDISHPQDQYFSDDSPWYSAAAAERWPTNDPEAGRALLEEYVQDPARSDGKPPGTPVSFRFDCLPDGTLVELAQMYQAFWDAVGFDVDLKQVDQATHISEAFAGDFDAKCWRVSSQDDPYSIFRDAFGSGPLNFTRFRDDRIDAAVEVLRTTTDLDERKAAVEEISLVLADEVPNTFVAGTPALLAARSEVKNLDGWTFPDGTTGEGVPGATTMWGHVWRADGA